jgi:hypothetical protein
VYIYSQGFLQNSIYIFLRFLQISINLCSLYEFPRLFKRRKEIWKKDNGLSRHWAESGWQARLDNGPRPAALWWPGLGRGGPQQGRERGRPKRPGGGGWPRRLPVTDGGEGGSSSSAPETAGSARTGGDSGRSARTDSDATAAWSCGLRRKARRRMARSGASWWRCTRGLDRRRRDGGRRSGPELGGEGCGDEACRQRRGRTRSRWLGPAMHLRRSGAARSARPKATKLPRGNGVSAEVGG